MKAFSEKVEIENTGCREAHTLNEATRSLIRKLDRAIAGLMVAILLTLAWPICRTLLPPRPAPKQIVETVVPGMPAIGPKESGWKNLPASANIPLTDGQAYAILRA